METKKGLELLETLDLKPLDFFLTILKGEVNTAQILLATNRVISAPDDLFLRKFNKFLQSTFLDVKWQLKATRMFDTLQTRQDYAQRLLNIIQAIDDEKKIDYLANLTKALLEELIDQPLYFKLINILQHITREELNYLNENINHNVAANLYTTALKSYNLVVSFVLPRDDKAQEALDDYHENYEFTPLALCMVKFAMRFGLESNEDEQRLDDYFSLIKADKEDAFSMIKLESLHGLELIYSVLQRQ